MVWLNRLRGPGYEASARNGNAVGGRPVRRVGGGCTVSAAAWTERTSTIGQPIPPAAGAGPAAAAAAAGEAVSASTGARAAAGEPVSAAGSSGRVQRDPADRKFVFTGRRAADAAAAGERG